MRLEIWLFPCIAAASESQSEDGKQAIERSLMSRIYTHAMFPNGDGDILRDQYVDNVLIHTLLTPWLLVYIWKLVFFCLTWGLPGAVFLP